jgi:hypothetical protein
MANTEFYSFKTVTCIDKHSKLVMPSNYVNLKITHYNEDEIKDLKPELKNVLFDDSVTEVELIGITDHRATKITTNKIYTLKLCERNNKADYTEIDVLFLSQERTLKQDALTNRIFYYGVKAGRCQNDKLYLFSTYKQKTFIIKSKVNSEILILKTLTQKDEQEIIEKYKQNNFDIFNIANYIEDLGTCSDGKPHKLKPE